MRAYVQEKCYRICFRPRRRDIKKQRHYFANKGQSSQGYGFSSGHVWMWELDCEESWVPKNWCFWTVVLEKTLLKLQYFGHLMRRVDSGWKRPWCWEGSGAGGGGDDRGWDGWMASPTWWTWVFVNSRSWWWTGRIGVLRFVGLQRVRHDWATELNWRRREFSGSSVVRTPSFHCQGPGFSPCLGNLDWKKKKKNKLVIRVWG